MDQPKSAAELPERTAALRCARCRTCWGRGHVSIRRTSARKSEIVDCACMLKPRTPPACRHPLTAMLHPGKARKVAAGPSLSSRY